MEAGKTIIHDLLIFTALQSGPNRLNDEEKNSHFIIPLPL